MKYSQLWAERVIYADGKILFKFTSAYLEEVKWPKGHNFTFGSRKFEYIGDPLNGMITDVQIFARSITAREALGFTSCQEVIQFKQLARYDISLRS